VGFEPRISADRQLQTYALERAATGTGAHYELETCNYTSKIANFLCMAYITGYGYTAGRIAILILGMENLRYHVTDRESSRKASLTINCPVNKWPFCHVKFLARLLASPIPHVKPYRTAEGFFPKISFWKLH